jgi:hypothetical protein
MRSSTQRSVPHLAISGNGERFFEDMNFRTMMAYIAAELETVADIAHELEMSSESTPQESAATAKAKGKSHIGSQYGSD